MEFEFDAQKRQDVYSKHGVDMLYAALIFENDVLTRRDGRKDYSEDRYISLGMVDGEPYIVVHTQRNGKIRLITAWKGGRYDKERYENRHS